MVNPLQQPTRTGQSTQPKATRKHLKQLVRSVGDNSHFLHMIFHMRDVAFIPEDIKHREKGSRLHKIIVSLHFSVIFLLTFYTHFQEGSLNLPHLSTTLFTNNVDINYTIRVNIELTVAAKGRHALVLTHVPMFFSISWGVFAKYLVRVGGRRCQFSPVCICRR